MLIWFVAHATEVRRTTQQILAARSDANFLQWERSWDTYVEYSLYKTLVNINCSETHCPVSDLRHFRVDDYLGQSQKENTIISGENKVYELITIVNFSSLCNTAFV